MATNRHPVDELSDVRAEMKRLKAREEELRDLILSNEGERTGDQFDADVQRTESERIDTAALRKEFGLERLKPFMRKSVVQTIRLSQRELVVDE